MLYGDMTLVCVYYFRQNFKFKILFVKFQNWFYHCQTFIDWFVKVYTF